MIARIEILNEQIRESCKDGEIDPSLSKLTVIAADAVGLYPSLDPEETARATMEEVLETELEFGSLNWGEMSKYLAVDNNQKL